MTTMTGGVGAVERPIDGIFLPAVIAENSLRAQQVGLERVRLGSNSGNRLAITRGMEYAPWPQGYLLSAQRLCHVGVEVKPKSTADIGHELLTGRLIRGQRSL